MGADLSHALRWWVWAAALTVVVVSLSGFLTGVRRNNPTLDFFDEEAHFAYVVSLQNGHLPAFGDRLTVGERRLVDCLAIGDQFRPAPCAAPPAPLSEQFAQGYDYEAQQPPLGYLPYLLTTSANVNPTSKAQATRVITSAREGGLIWIALSGLLLLLLAATEQLSLLALSCLLCSCLLNPVFTNAAATVNNDAAGVAAGAACLLAWSAGNRIQHRQRRVLFLAICAGLFVGLTKGLFIVVPFALLMAAFAGDYPRWLSRDGMGQLLKRHIATVAMFVASFASYLAWIAVQELRATVRPSVVQLALEGYTKTATFHPSAIGSSVEQLLALYQPYFLAMVSNIDSPINVVWGLAAFGVIVGLVCLPAAKESNRRARDIAVAITVSIVVLGVGFPILEYVSGHYDLGAYARYAIPILPLIAYSIARGCRRFGVAVVGILLPIAAAIVQLAVLKY
jgi:hypothetical protein